MGSRITTMFTKVLFAACALFVVAHATDIYVATWQGTDCSGTAARSWKSTLDRCFNGGLPTLFKTTLSGSTYTMNAYGVNDTLCWVPAVTASGAADACLTFAGKGLKVLSGSAHLSGAATTGDCTSGTCVADTGNSACHVSIGIMSVFLGLVAHWIA